MQAHCEIAYRFLSFWWRMGGAVKHAREGGPREFHFPKAEPTLAPKPKQPRSQTSGRQRHHSSKPKQRQEGAQDITATATAQEKRDKKGNQNITGVKREAGVRVDTGTGTGGHGMP